MSPADDSLESVERSLVFSSLILLPYSIRAAIVEVLSWESSLDSSRVRGLLIVNTGSSSSISRKEPRSGCEASGLDYEDRAKPVPVAMRGEVRLVPRSSVLVTSLRGWDPG